MFLVGCNIKTCRYLKIGRISSGKTSDNDKSHHDYIIDRDIQLWKKYFNIFDFEVEAKLKDKAILKILEVV